MKKIIYTFAVWLAGATLYSVTAQVNVSVPTPPVQVSNTIPATVAKYGFISFKSVRQQMPEFAEAQTQIAKVREQYQAETKHNEATFNQMFADFLAGQKDFPQTILLKRQKELQMAMEKSISFRSEALKIVQDNENAIMRIVDNKLSDAIKRIGIERGLEYIVNTDEETYLYLNPKLSIDITPDVYQKLGLTPTP